VGAGLTVPPNGKIQARAEDPGRFEKRIIIIKSPGATLTITTNYSWGGNAPNPLMGIKLPEPVWSSGYTVTVDADFHKNDHTRTAYEEWVDGVTHVLNEADWETVEAAIEKVQRDQLLGLK
jgi:hypothetical protein